MPEAATGPEAPAGGAGQGTGDPLWDDWDTPLRAPATPLLHLDGYDGPMELLLDLAGRQRVDLGRLSILGLIGQFLAELDGRLRQVAIERRADWLVTANRLVLLRSRLVAPASPEAAATARSDADAAFSTIELRAIWSRTTNRVLNNELYGNGMHAAGMRRSKGWRHRRTPALRDGVLLSLFRFQFECIRSHPVAVLRVSVVIP